MMVTQTLDLNLVPGPGNSRAVAHVSQYDVGRQIVFNLYSGTVAFTPTAGSVIVCNGTKSNGTGFASSTTWSGNVVTVTTDAQMTDFAGISRCELVITVGDVRVGTANFLMVVEQAGVNEDTEFNLAQIAYVADALNQIGDAQSVFETLTDRIDNIVAPSGDPTLTEVADIRVGYDGETYSSAGSAVREQIADLHTEIHEIVPGLSDEAKQALLACFRNVAWLDDGGYYEALRDTLYPEGDYSLNATFTQGSNIFTTTDDLDDLRNYLVVTITYPGSSSVVVTNYTLSGVLSSGTSTITVTYGDKTTTFSVVVKSLPSGYTLKNYIESDRSQYIQTAITEYEAGNYGYKMRLMPTDATPTTRTLGHVFSSPNMFALVFRHEVSGTDRKFISAQRWGGQIVQASNAWETGTIYSIEEYIDSNTNEIRMNDVLAGTCDRGTTYNENSTMFLLGYSGGPDRTDFRYSGRVYSIKMYELGTSTKAHDFVPCINSSSIAGLYDMVTDTFYPPTVGTLVAG